MVNNLVGWKIGRTGQIDSNDHERKVPQHHEEYLPEPPFLRVDRCDLHNSFQHMPISSFVYAPNLFIYGRRPVVDLPPVC